jgi:hypothetical protein
VDADEGGGRDGARLAELELGDRHVLAPADLRGLHHEVVEVVLGVHDAQRAHVRTLARREGERVRASERGHPVAAAQLLRVVVLGDEGGVEDVALGLERVVLGSPPQPANLEPAPVAAAARCEDLLHGVRAVGVAPDAAVVAEDGGVVLGVELGLRQAAAHLLLARRKILVVLDGVAGEAHAQAHHPSEHFEDFRVVP